MDPREYKREFNAKREKKMKPKGKNVTLNYNVLSLLLNLKIKQ